MMDAKENKRAGEAGSAILALLKCFVTVWAFSGDSLSLMLSGYAMDVPVFKYIFTLFHALDGWGLDTLFMALGLGTIYYVVRGRQKSPWVSGISLFFAICTVIGISYAKTSSWDCIFLFKLQFALALFVMLGYYFAYKNCILFVGWCFEKNPGWLRREPVNQAEQFLFQAHPFLGPLLFVFICALPWLIFFFPGTLHGDAYSQLAAFFGSQAEIARANHPIIMTHIMGGCVWLGRQLFGSDNIGLFFYTSLQFMAQSLIFSYASLVLRRLKAPILFCWGALLYWAAYPFFPIWGYTMVKDTPFYGFILLHIVVLMDIIIGEKTSRVKWQQMGLFLLSIAGVTLSRNDGRYIILPTLFCALILYRSYWKMYAAGIALCLLLTFLVNYVYMPLYGISRGGNTGDMLSIPLQQTARYLKEHFEEVTEEEAKILQEGFLVSLEEVAQLYQPTCVDAVKFNLQRSRLDIAYLQAYLKVWFQQLRKHPDTYVQAFLNQNYRYFYPNEHDWLYGWKEDTVTLFMVAMVNQVHDDYVDIAFVPLESIGRAILQNFYFMVQKMPIFSMLLSPGFHVYIFWGELAYLLAKRRCREILFLIPLLFVFLLRLISPVANVRYLLPIMAALPVTAAWCYIAAHKEDSECHIV